MRPRLLIGLLLACGALLSLATPAHAGPVVITLEQLPAELRAGEPFTVGFMVVSHSEQESLAPIAGLKPTVIANQGKERVQVFAEPAATPGHYVATLTLPNAGEWAWGINAFGGPDTYALTPLQVGEAAGAAAAEPAGVNQGSETGWARVALRASGVLLLLAALVLLLARPQRRWLQRPTGPA